MVCGAFSLAGLTTCAVAVTGLVHDRTAVRDFGVTTAPDAHPRDTSPTTVPSRGRSSRPPAADPQFVAGPPTRLQIPVLKVDATIDSVATVAGQLTVPDDPMTVGWWAGAAQPGSRAGTVVLDGHVDSAHRGLGAFFHLTALRAGDIVTVTTTGGDQVTYRVTARLFYPKAAGLPPNLFATSGPPRLVLITCGGPFDDHTLSYQDNIVVFAAPTSIQPT